VRQQELSEVCCSLPCPVSLAHFLCLATEGQLLPRHLALVLAPQNQLWSCSRWNKSGAGELRKEHFLESNLD